MWYWLCEIRKYIILSNSRNEVANVRWEALVLSVISPRSSILLSTKSTKLSDLLVYLKIYPAYQNTKLPFADKFINPILDNPELFIKTLVQLNHFNRIDYLLSIIPLVGIDFNAGSDPFLLPSLKTSIWTSPLCVFVATFYGQRRISLSDISYSLSLVSTDYRYNKNGIKGGIIIGENIGKIGKYW